MDQPFVPASELQRLRTGSYESLTAEITQACQDSHVLEAETVVFATYPDHAIVTTQDARFARIVFERANDGKLTIVHTEELQVPVIRDEATLSAYVQSHAADVVDAIQEGKGVRAASLLREILAIADKTPKAGDTESVSAVIAKLRASRPWYTVIGESVPLAGPGKFVRITEGVIPKDQLSGYLPLVRRDVEILVGQLDAAASVVEASFASLTTRADTTADSVSPEETALREAASDLLRDIADAQLAVTECIARIRGDVPAMARLHDELLVTLHKFDLAGKMLTSKVTPGEK